MNPEVHHRYLVTGGAGFIGSHLVEALLRQGRDVVVFDDFSTGTRTNLSSVEDHPRLRIIEGTVLESSALDFLVNQADVVVHLAAAVGVEQILRNPLSSLRSNVRGAENVFEACSREDKLVLFASTSEVYGKNTDPRLCEDSDSVLGSSSISRWSYATAKKLDEFFAAAYAGAEGLEFIGVRFFNVVGPRQASRYGMVLPKFVRAALSGEPLRVYGDGLQSRNFTHVDDCVEAMLALLAAKSAMGEIVNIGGREEVKIVELAERVKRLTRSNSPIVYVPYAEAYPNHDFEDMRKRTPCLCKIERIAGWQPSKTVDDAISETAAYERRRMKRPIRPAPPARPLQLSRKASYAAAGEAS